MDLEFKQLIDIDDKTLDIIIRWMFDWWEKDEGYSYEKLRYFMKHTMQKDKLPQTYGLFLDNQIIGMYQFTFSDLDVRPDIYPWLANLYIDEKYRGKGYGRILIENATKKAQEIIKDDEIFLFTEHVGLYEKFGWKYLCDINTFNEVFGTERLYKLKIYNKGK